jgi:Ca-activated chloride channel family protein
MSHNEKGTPLPIRPAMTPMRRLLALALALASLPALLVAQPAPIFRAATQIVPLYVTVTDATRRLVPGLEQGDFTVLDNGVPQELTLFDNNPRPFSVVVMLDTSLSMTLNLDLVKRAAEQFLFRLTPEDQGMVGAFNDKIQFASDLTNDRDSLVGALDDLMFGNPTRLYDAVDQAIDQLRPVEGRKVVLVFTDGDDTASKTGLGDAMAKARNEEVMVYAIGLESTMTIGGMRQRTRPDRGLRKLADETGGGYFELKSTDELGTTFTRVAQELRAQYVLGFSPAALDGKVHKLEVRLKQPNLNARARKSYLAAAPKASAQ